MAARVVQDLTGWPSIRTTQAPQLDVSQPQWVPVSSSVSRMKCTSSIRGSMSWETCVPLTVIVTLMVMPPGAAHARSRGAELVG